MIYFHYHDKDTRFLPSVAKGIKTSSFIQCKISERNPGAKDKLEIEYRTDLRTSV